MDNNKMYAIVYHNGNVCVYVDNQCKMSAVTYKKGEERSIKTLLNDAVDLLYRILIDDYMQHNNDVQQYIDDMESVLK